VNGSVMPRVVSSFLPPPEIGVAVLDVQVGMAQPATLDADQHFVAWTAWACRRWFRTGGIELDQRLATHQRHGIFSSGHV
jgi:hypothetical protein